MTVTGVLNPPGQHPCVMDTCQDLVPKHLLMCGLHWKMVPRDIQEEIYQTYKLRSRGCEDAQQKWTDASSRASKAVERFISRNY